MRIKGILKLKVAILIFVIVTISFLIIVRPIDIINTRGFLYYSSFFYLSLNPNAYYRIPTPPVFLSILLPQFCIYLLTLSLRSVSFFFAIINLIFSVLSSIVIMKIIIALTNNKDKAYSAFYVILFSPFIFFINYIFVEQDILAIFLTLSSFYLLYFNRKISLQLAGMFLLAYATFFYYFPILIVPSIIVYKKDWKDRLISFSLMVFALSLLYLSFLKYMLWSFLVNSTGAIAASSGGVPVFNILNIFPGGISQPFTPLISEVYNVLFIGVATLVLIIPVVFKLLKKSITLPLLATFSLPFLFLKIYNGDEFIWIIPFATIAIAYYSNNNLLKTKLIFSQLYMVPLIVILNMWGAPNYGYGTGIFYFTYMTFHLPIAVYSIIPHYLLVNKTLDVTIFILIFLNIFYALILSRNKRESSFKIIENTNIEGNEKLRKASSKLYNYKADDRTSKKAYRSSFNKLKKVAGGDVTGMKLIVVTVMLLLIGTVILVPYHVYDDRNITYSKGAFPVGLFTTNNTLMVKGLSYSFMVNSSFIQFYNYSGNLVPSPTFSRNITGQNLDMNMEIVPELPKEMVYSDLVAGFNGMDLYVLNQLKLPKDYGIITPWRSQNLSLASNQELSLLNVPSISTMVMSGNSIEEYNLSITPNTTYVLGFDHNTVNWPQNLFFYSQIGGVSYEFFYSTNSLIFGYLSDGSWKYESVNPLYYSTSWNIMSFSMINDSILFDVNGMNVFSYTYNNSHIVSNYTYVGMAAPYSPYVYKFAFAGKVTSLLSVNSSSMNINKKLEIVTPGREAILPFESNNVTITASEYSVKFLASGEPLTINGSFSTFWFGRDSQYSPGVEYAFHYLEINSTTYNGLFLRILVLLYIIPLFVMELVVMETVRFRRYS